MASHAFASRGLSCREPRPRPCDALPNASGAVYQELITLVWDHPAWLDDYFCLTPYQKLMWFAAQGRWHGIARADLFLCTDGRVQCCEVNSDTPSGEAEAVLLNRLLAAYHGAVHDPNRRLPGAFWRMLVASHGGRQPRTVGIVYPTELTEDLSMIALYREWLEAHGCQVILGSPYNVHTCQGRRGNVWYAGGVHHSPLQNRLVGRASERLARCRAVPRCGALRRRSCGSYWKRNTPAG